MLVCYVGWMINLDICSYSCLIDEGKTFLLTGGEDFVTETSSRVSRYDINGWLEDLDDLNTGRSQHGCARYTNNNGDKVRMECVLTSPVCFTLFTVRLD